MTRAGANRQEGMMTNENQLDPYKTILVCRVDGKEVGRKSAKSPNANAWLQEMALSYTRDGKMMTVDYVEDENACLLAAMGL